MGLRFLKRSRVLLLFAFLVTSTQSFSKEDWTFYGVRPLAMGNAFVSVADDFNALYYNPAGLARIKEWGMEIVNPRFDISTNTYFLAKSIKSKGKMELSDELDIIDENAGKPNYVGFSLSPYFIAPGWGFGISSNTFFSFIAHRNVAVDLNAKSKLLIPISKAANFFSDRLSLGVTLKPQAVGGMEREISVNNISVISSDTDSDKKLEEFIESGKGFGVDFGLLFTPKDTPMEPTFGMSITDFGGTKLTRLLKKGSVSKNIPPSVNTGMSFKLFKTERQYLLVAIDTQMINQDRHFSHKFGMGVEYGLTKYIKVEAGLWDGQVTGGLQLDAWLLKLRLATYAVDRGKVAGQDKRFVERRVALQLKLLI